MNRIKKINIDSELFCKEDRNINNYTIHMISFAYTDTDSKAYGINVEKEIISHLQKEINDSVYKQIFSELRSNATVEYIDMVGNSMFNELDFVLQSSKFDAEIYFITPYENMVCGVQLGSAIQDLRHFTCDATRQNSNICMYIGKIANTRIYVNQYQSWNDKSVLFFNDVRFNYLLDNTSIIDEATFRPRVNINYKLSIKTNECLLRHFVNDENSPEFKHIIPQRRDKKIDTIINN